MNVIVVDDERLILDAETSSVKRALPNAVVSSFQTVKDAIDYAQNNKIDIAFLDINIKGVTGLELAKKLQEFNPRLNVIFCTGYSEYSLEALDLYCSAYLLKPVTEEKIRKALRNLRYPITNKINGFKVRCFGNFEVYKDDVPIKFKNRKTKELFAYLIDRKGSTVSTKDIMVALYEDDNKESYIRNLRADLNNTLESLSLSNVLIKNGSNIGINTELIDCDYYDYLAGKKELFNGEYMSQFDFAEATLSWLENNE